MQIRSALPADLGGWVSLRRELWPDSGDCHHQELTQFFDGTSSDIEQALIAIEQDVPVGFIEINLRNFAEGSREPVVPYVEAWCVDPDYRGQGIGRALMRAAEDWALNSGYRQLASDTEIHNEYSIDLHQRLGFSEVERVVCFLKELRPQSDLVDQGESRRSDLSR